MKSKILSTLLGLTAAMSLTGCQNPANPGQANASAAGGYVCPMHPEVTTGAAAACPKCGMALIKR